MDSVLEKQAQEALQPMVFERLPYTDTVKRSVEKSLSDLGFVHIAIRDDGTVDAEIPPKKYNLSLVPKKASIN